MAEKGKIKKLLSCTIECRGMTLVALVGGIGAVVYLDFILGFISRLLIGYGLLVLLCLYLLRKKSKKFERFVAWSILVMFYGIIPCWIFIGGIDCEPPDDADLRCLNKASSDRAQEVVYGCGAGCASVCGTVARSLRQGIAPKRRTETRQNAEQNCAKTPNA